MKRTFEVVLKFRVITEPEENLPRQQLEELLSNSISGFIDPDTFSCSNEEIELNVQVDTCNSDIEVSCKETFLETPKHEIVELSPKTDQDYNNWYYSLENTLRQNALKDYELQQHDRVWDNLSLDEKIEFYVFVQLFYFKKEAITNETLCNGLANMIETLKGIKFKVATSYQAGNSSGEWLLAIVTDEGIFDEFHYYHECDLLNDIRILENMVDFDEI